jgi:hypothetical protein
MPDINIDVLGIGRRTQSAINFIVILLIIAVILIISLIFGIGCIIFPGLTEMSMDIIRGHTGRFVLYFALSLVSNLFVILFFSGTGKFFKCLFTLFLIMGIWGHIIDPAFSRGYNVYVCTNDGGKYYVKNAKLWRMNERIEGFDLSSGYIQYHVCLGKIAWLYIERSRTVTKEKFLFWDVDSEKKSTLCSVYFDKEKKLEGEVKLLGGNELILKGKNRSGETVSINIADIYEIMFPPWRPSDNYKSFR